MPYYVEDPEGQTPADLSAEASAKEGSLTVSTPEEIKLLDPACGSGHMLTYAFDLLVKIYEEEGYAPSEHGLRPIEMPFCIPTCIPRFAVIFGFWRKFDIDNQRLTNPFSTPFDL